MTVVKKRTRLTLIAILGVMILCLGVCYAAVSINASGRIFSKIEDVPSHEYGLLLGTSPITPQGARNYDFDERIKAVVDLYDLGKVRTIIASGGDYSGKQKHGCNELEAMRDSLLAHRVDSNNIILDYEGLRPVNSIVKIKDIMGVDSCIIISQEYQNQRAIWQAEHYGLKAVGYNAAPPRLFRSRIKNMFLEIFARFKMIFDLWFGHEPNCKQKEIIYAWYPPAIEEFRDTLVGVFNGMEKDTLVAEPIGDYLRSNLYSGYYEWRVRTVRKTVANFNITGTTIGIRFVKEGDLDGDGKEEWGYVTQWPTSNWMSYHLFTNVNGHWKHMIEPTCIYLGHLEEDNSSGWYSPPEGLVRPSGRKGFLRVRFSDVRHDGEDFMLIDTLIRIKPVEAEGFD